VFIHCILLWRTKGYHACTEPIRALRGLSL